MGTKKTIGTREVFGFPGIIDWKTYFLMFTIHLKKINITRKECFLGMFLTIFFMKTFPKASGNLTFSSLIFLYYIKNIMLFFIKLYNMINN